MKRRCLAVLAVAFIAVAAPAQDRTPASAGPNVTPEAKAALERMAGAADRPVDRGLKSMTGVVEGTLNGGVVEVDVSFTAPAAFKAESAAAQALLELAMNGARRTAWLNDDVETAARDGKDLLLLTRRDSDGGTSRARYTLDADGLPASYVLEWKRSAAGAEEERNGVMTFTWTRAGERSRLAQVEMTTGQGPGGKPASVATTFTYESFGGIAIPTSWVTVTTSGTVVAQTMTYRFTELSLDRRVVLKGGQRVLTSTSLPSKVPIAVTGSTYVHEPSGMKFPKMAAHFARVVTDRYDQEGHDVGVGYRRIWSRIHVEVTVFVYPILPRPDGTPTPYDEQFEGEVDSLLRRHKEVKEVGRTNGSATYAGKAVSTRTAEFQFRDADAFEGRPVRSYLTAFRSGPWHVTYRVTATLERRDEALAALEELLAALELPPTGLPAAKTAEKR